MQIAQAQKILPCQTDALLAQALRGCCGGTHKCCHCHSQWWPSITLTNSRTGLHRPTSFTNSCYACTYFLLSPSPFPFMLPKASAGHATECSCVRLTCCACHWLCHAQRLTQLVLAAKQGEHGSVQRRQTGPFLAAWGMN